MSGRNWQRERERQRAERPTAFGSTTSEGAVAAILAGPSKAELRAAAADAVATAPRLVVCACGHRGRVPPGAARLKCSRCGASILSA